MPGRVLIFEDAQETLDAYVRLFSERGIATKFHSTRDLARADIEKFEEFSPNLIITDLLLGESKLDGYRLIRRLQEVDDLKDIPIVVVSKFINSSKPGQREADDVETLPGVVATYSKIPELPSPEILLKHAKI